MTEASSNLKREYKEETPKREGHSGNRGIPTSKAQRNREGGETPRRERQNPRDLSGALEARYLKGRQKVKRDAEAARG